MDEDYNEQNEIVGEDGSTGVPYRIRIEGHAEAGKASVTIWFGADGSHREKAVVSGDAATESVPNRVHDEIQAIIRKGVTAYRQANPS